MKKARAHEPGGDSPLDPKGVTRCGRELSEDERLHFRDQLRAARAEALEDAEGSHAIIVAIERLGATLSGRQKNGLGAYQDQLRELAAVVPEASVELDALFAVVREGRNQAVHGGVYARHLSARSTELALMLEAGLMANFARVKHFMVKDPVRAEPWHSLAHVRHVLLASSFSHLPLFAPRQGETTSEWWLVSDRAVARALRTSDQSAQRSAACIQDAWREGYLQLEKAPILSPEEDIANVFDRVGALPGLVIDPAQPSALLGIVTAFDLL